jgi:hypothetical protein
VLSAVSVHSSTELSRSSTLMTYLDLEATVYCCFDFFSLSLKGPIVKHVLEPPTYLAV